MHPLILHQLARQQSELARAGTRARRDERLAPGRARGASWRRAKARAQAGVGWALVDLGFRLATRNRATLDEPYARARG